MPDQNAIGPEPSPETAARHLHRALLERWNQRDATGFARLYAEDGSQVGFDGSAMNGRAEIQTHLAAIFGNHPTAAYVAIVREVRALSPDVAMLRAVAGMVPPGASDLKPEVNAIQTLVAVRRSDGWLVALFQNTPAAFHGRPEKVQELTAELRGVLQRGTLVE